MVNTGQRSARTMLIQGNWWLRARLIQHSEILRSENLEARFYTTNQMHDAKPIDLSFSKISTKGQGDCSAPALKSVSLETFCDSMWPTHFCCFCWVLRTLLQDLGSDLFKIIINHTLSNPWEFLLVIKESRSFILLFLYIVQPYRKRMARWI